MKDEFEIDAQSREDAGKGASRRLRREGLVPGIIYGGKSEPKMVSLKHNELEQHLEHEAFYSHVLKLKVDGKAEQVILKDLQRHPAKPMVMHVDFQRVSADTKLRTSVPLHFVGEDVAPGIKMGGAASHYMTSVEVLCLPKDLPEYINVDITEMQIGDNVHLSELKLPKGVEITALSHGEEQDALVVSIHSAHAGMSEEGGDGTEGDGVSSSSGETAGGD